MNKTLYLAPIRGVTDRTYRNIFPKYFEGIDIAIAPFLSTSIKNKLKGSFIKEFLPELNYGLKTIPQILSKDPRDFVPLANSLNDLGYNIINWNLGCPYPMVVNKGKGSGLLPYPQKIESFLETTIPELKPKLSIKLRLGLDFKDEIFELIPIFNKYPIEEIIIHCRTGKQMYKGTVDLDTFEKCLNMSKHKVVYNGDINNKNDFENIRNKFTNINNFMIGRGILHNPFLAEEIKFNKTYTESEKLEKIYNFHNDLYNEYSKILSGPSHITDRMKNVWFYLASNFKDSKKVLKKIKKTINQKKYLEAIDDIFKNNF